MTLADTAAALASGIPIRNLNRLRRVRTMDTTTELSDDGPDAATADMDGLRDLVARATPVLVEIRRATSGGAKVEVHDDDLAAAVLAVDPDAEVRHFPEVDERPEFWVVETTEWMCFTWRRPGGGK